MALWINLCECVIRAPDFKRSSTISGNLCHTASHSGVYPKIYEYFIYKKQKEVHLI